MVIKDPMVLFTSIRVLTLMSWLKSNVSNYILLILILSVVSAGYDIHCFLSWTAEVWLCFPLLLSLSLKQHMNKSSRNDDMNK